MKDTTPAIYEFLRDVGVRYRTNDKSLIIRMISMTKPGERLSDREVVAFARAADQYMCSIDGSKSVAPVDGHFKVFSNADFRTQFSRYAYKFISKDDYEKYIKKGSFLVSSLERYRQMEKTGNVAGDRFEGTCFGVYASGDRELTVAAISGYDTFIFSATRDLKNSSHMRKFGDVILRIEIRPFAAALARALKCRPQIELVRYGDYKVHRGKLGKIADHIDSVSLSVRAVKKLTDLVRLPSILAKPQRFECEREVRIILPQRRDVELCQSITITNFENYVERID